nr:hypothetical protein [Salmonella enterica subsp. enterica serovar Rissen]
MDSITLKDGFAFPFVRSDKKRLKPRLLGKLLLCHTSFFKQSEDVSKKIRLYTIRLRLNVNFSG